MKKALMLIIILIIIVLGLLWQQNNKKTVEETKNPEETNSSISQTAKYKIEFIAEWSSVTHPNDYPSGAHFSPFVAYSHNNLSKAKSFTKGKTPTPGIEEMSETGATEILVKEIQDIIDSNFAYRQTKGVRIDSPGYDSSQLDFSQDFSQITFVSMLAPSPDWFVAGSVNLFKNNQWVEKIEIDLITYDSGGDEGTDFTSKNQNTNPKQPIEVFNENLQNLGKIILTKHNNL